MPNIGGGEFLLLIVLALVILGPDKLPQYAAKLAQFVRTARDMAEGAKSQIREEMGPSFDDVDWRALDPRQYDPRRIMREALSGPDARDGADESRAPAETRAGRAANEAAIGGSGMPGQQLRGHDPTRPTPWDVDAT